MYTYSLPSSSYDGTLIVPHTHSHIMPLYVNFRLPSALLYLTSSLFIFGFLISLSGCLECVVSGSCGLL